jgi:hypothetical protein
MKDDFVLAIMKTPSGEFIIVDKMPNEFDEPAKPYTKSEIEYIVNRVSFDLQSKRMAEFIAEKISPEQESVSKKVRSALDKRKKES